MKGSNKATLAAIDSVRVTQNDELSVDDQLDKSLASANMILNKRPSQIALSNSQKRLSPSQKKGIALVSGIDKSVQNKVLREKKYSVLTQKPLAAPRMTLGRN